MGNNPVCYKDPDGRDIVYLDDNGNEKKREVSDRNEIHTPKSDLEMMKQNAREMENHKGNFFFFAKNVKSGGKWDFKNADETVYRSYYWFGNDLVTAEEFGNIHYGYVGAAGGFGKLLLIDAPGLIQVHNGTAKAEFALTNFDDPRDTKNIIKGFDAYEMPLSTKISSRDMDAKYLQNEWYIRLRVATAIYYGITLLNGKNKS